jgi:alanine dehydrogenase
MVDGVLHYCVANIPGAVSRTSSQALCNATLPYARQLAKNGVDGFAALSKGHASAINMRSGKLIHPGVIAAFPDLPKSN